MTLFGTFGALLPLPDLTDHSIFVAFGGKNKDLQLHGEKTRNGEVML